MAPAASPPALQEAIQISTSVWQSHLESLFKLAKDRFPDVVWELGDGEHEQVEEVWGHKAIVYARAPPSFQARYFSFRPSPNATQSALSLPDFRSGSSSPYRAGSPSPSANPGTLLRLPTTIKSALFSNELEYLYTGKGFGAAFEFLFDTTESREEGDAEESRIDKLRKDLVFMWRSRLYSDIRIALTGTFASVNHENATAIFSSHRFILVSRSSYFHSQLLSWGVSPKPGEPLTLTLPSPPFTPASLHFTLGFIYTGTLVFSHRSYDLDTGFHIMRSASYLSIDSLYDEVQARIVQEMLHGLFHAFLEFAEYERITGGKWGTGGCRCRQCARRVPRVLEFALSDDVKNPHLERGARRALVGLFGEGWCTSEFAGLTQKMRDSLLKGLAKRTTPVNIFPLLFAAQHAMEKLNAVIDAWADISRDMVLAARKVIDDALCLHAEECFEQREWIELLEGDGVSFEAEDQAALVMESVKRGLSERSAGMVYQVLVSAILLRPHATDTDLTMLPPASRIRDHVETVRMDVLKWLRKRWMGVRQEGGFNALEGWAVKEISGEIEVSVEDLINNSPSTTTPPRGLPSRAGLRATLSKVDPDADSVSLRASVLSRNTMKRSVTPSKRERDRDDQSVLSSSASSVRSVARSEASSTATYTTTKLPPNLPEDDDNDTPKDIASGSRPDSKLTPSSVSTSVRSSVASGVSQSTTPAKSHKTLVTKVTPRISPSAGTRTPSVHSSRPKSLAPSVASSTRSKTPPSRYNLRPPGGPSSRPPSSRPMSSRPLSSLSATSDGSTTFKSAQSELMLSSPTISRRTSVASTMSNSSNKTQGPSTGKITLTRPRVPSTASATSASSKPKRPSPVASLAPSESSKSPSPAAVRRPHSMASVKSTVSSINATPTKKTVARKVSSSMKSNGQPSPSSTMKGKHKAASIVEEEIPQGKASMESNSTIRTIRRKGSSDTIKTAAPIAVDKPLPPTKHEQKPNQSRSVPLVHLDEMHEMPPRGATLEIGIPCIISSKRKRFRAYARYIGEVEGESGPWVGVEVPVGESWVGEKLEGRQWHDGTWGGVRYFDIGAAGSEWDDGDNDRSVRRRKLDIMNGSKGLKREGDQLNVDRAKRLRSASPATSDVSMSESRGLFVRPQQVLYVVDAVGSD